MTSKMRSQWKPRYGPSVGARMSQNRRDNIAAVVRSLDKKKPFDISVISKALNLTNFEAGATLATISDKCGVHALGHGKWGWD